MSKNIVNPPNPDTFSIYIYMAKWYAAKWPENISMQVYNVLADVTLSVPTTDLYPVA